MNFEQAIAEAGGYKNLFAKFRKAGVNLEQQITEIMGEDNLLFKQAGFKVTKMVEGYVESTFPQSETVTRRGGMVHGGIIMYSLDNAGGLAVMTMNPGFDQVTLELKINYLEQLRKGPFTVIGKVVRVGGTTAVAEGEVRDADGKICAKSLGTWFMFRQKKE
jgi:uncharacterized protein (TIGR00369 family)